ncbi:proline betaine transport protein like protein [Legionella birminghamensis]|uniref:Proline betaine transport protein like protein n=1 Tax=Legionella birminghamensis TaxID=28083 RepID=A0A378IDP3_9GAMM|nr:MFS transporter [Legionella birminghamensis]KTC72580.1 proline betaine transport protein like protein [Legionella birminghamensis]STX32852.1 proline betaine transport protein like protein [Legionella birminghamensis]
MRSNQSIKVLFTAIAGTSLQWYDFALFGYFAPIIAASYFPKENQLAALLSAFGVLAVGYLLAPLGSLFFGYIGDRFGRKQALMLSILAMAIPTAAAGCVPSYSVIGIAAPILITMLRIIQGFVASSEYTGSTLFLIEHAPSNKKALYGCLSSSAYSIGSIGAGLAASFFTASFMPAWGWRIAFILAGIFGLFIFYLRNSLEETPEFKQIHEEEKKKVPFLTAVHEKPLAIMGVIGLAWLTGIMTFGTYVFSASYLHHYFNISLSFATLAISFALFVDVLIEPCFAWLADKIGHLKMITAGCMGIILLAIPAFYLLSSANTTFIVLALVLLSLLIAITFSPLNAYMTSLFPRAYRYSGFGVSFHIGISVFGGTVPLVMMWLTEKTGNLLAPAWYYIFGAIIGLISLGICELSRARQPHSQAEFSLGHS